MTDAGAKTQCQKCPSSAPSSTSSAGPEGKGWVVLGAQSSSHTQTGATIHAMRRQGEADQIEPVGMPGEAKEH